MVGCSDELTICIKTFIRKKSLWTLLTSIRFHYPDVKIIVVDDSPITYRRSTINRFSDLNLHYISLPFDSGVSVGRNTLLKNVKTKYFLLCDDDFEFSDETNLPYNLNLIDKSNLDILGGSVIEKFKVNSFWALIRLIRNSIFSNRIDYTQKTYTSFTRTSIQGNVLINKYISDSADEILSDLSYIRNFFIARTEKIKMINGWQPESLKIGGHALFFNRAYFAGLKMGFSKRMTCNSVKYMPLVYMVFRMRSDYKFNKIAETEKLSIFKNFGIEIVRNLDSKGNILSEYEI
jgi:glycosyltransferase involved in cell wall biosynthesis